MERLRKTFCSMGNIPINIYSNPHFLNRIKLLDPIYHTDSLWTEFLKATDYYKTSNDYEIHLQNITSQINNLVDERITNSILNNATRSIEVAKYRRDMDIFEIDNIGQKFARIYICDKSFSALRWLSSTILDNKKTYSEFIRKYTDDKNIISNFDVQDRILGLWRNRKLRFAVDALTVEMLTRAVLKCFALRHIRKACDGEIIIELAQNQSIISYSNLNEIIEQWARLSKVKFELEVFTVGFIKGINTYIKKYETGKIGRDNISIVKPDPNTIALGIKALTGQPIQDTDKYFCYNCCLSKFLETPNIEVIYNESLLE